MGTFPRLHSLTTRVLTVDRVQTKDISGTIRLLKHPPSKELRSLYIVIFPDLGTDRYLSLRLGDLDDALVAAAAANPWKNIHFSFVIYALKEEEEDVLAIAIAIAALALLANEIARVRRVHQQQHPEHPHQRGDTQPPSSP